MAYDWTLYFCLFLALWSAMTGGVFSAFSEFIMAGLRRAEPAGGIEVMQHINRTVIKNPFVTGILCITIFSVLFAFYGASHFYGFARVNLILASIAFVIAVFFTTAFGNVPMNKKLDRFKYNSVEAKAYWSEYGRNWTRLNHIRSLGSIITAILYTITAIQLLTSGQVGELKW